MGDSLESKSFSLCFQCVCVCVLSVLSLYLPTIHARILIYMCFIMSRQVGIGMCAVEVGEKETEREKERERKREG